MIITTRVLHVHPAVNMCVACATTSGLFYMLTTAFCVVLNISSPTCENNSGIVCTAISYVKRTQDYRIIVRKFTYRWFMHVLRGDADISGKTTRT